MVALSALEHYFQHSFTLDEDGLFDNEVTLYSTRIWHLKWLWALFLQLYSTIQPSYFCSVVLRITDILGHQP